MKQIRFAFMLSLALPGAALANDWKDSFVRWLPEGEYVRAEGNPVTAPSTGSVDADFGEMYRKGLIPIGYSLFESGNGQTKDGERWAKELGASYVIFGVDLKSSETFSVPLSLPTTNTSTTFGTANRYGSSGTSFGNFNATTTTTSNQTTYIPVVKNRFSKSAIYFAPEPKSGAGIYSRQVSPQEMQALGTRFVIAVRFVRDYSPAYYADILPGDMIIKINGKPAENNTWWTEILDERPDSLEIVRAGKTVDVTLTVPEDWRTAPAASGASPK